MLPMQLRFDIVYDLARRFGRKVRLVTPTPCTHDDQIASNIAAPRAAIRSFHGSWRFSTHFYRLGNEAGRLFYGLTKALQDKLGCNTPG